MEVVTHIFGRNFGKLSSVDVLLLGVVVIGLLFSAVSLFRGILEGHQVQIEYLNSDTRSNGDTENKIFVDVEGAVMKPGVYEMKSDARLKDALVAAGGYSEMADRVYCEKTFNMAQSIKDGQKIYIPSVTDTPTSPRYPEANSGAKLVNINTASLIELDTLWGVGPSRAEAIVKNRPYESIEELVSKGAVSKQILEKNREVLAVY